MALREIVISRNNIRRGRSKQVFKIYDQRYHSGTHTCAVQSLNDRKLGKLKRKQTMEERQERIEELYILACATLFQFVSSSPHPRQKNPWWTSALIWSHGGSLETSLNQTQIQIPWWMNCHIRKELYSTLIWHRASELTPQTSKTHSEDEDFQKEWELDRMLLTSKLLFHGVFLSWLIEIKLAQS